MFSFPCFDLWCTLFFPVSRVEKPFSAKRKVNLNEEKSTDVIQKRKYFKLSAVASAETIASF